LSILKSNIKEKNIKSDIDWYVGMRGYDSTPHAGFGLGFERFISYLTGFKNVRDTIQFPRTTGSIIG
jgi:asparaginyl-tRNA synthetase